MHTSIIRYHFARYGAEYTGKESYYSDLNLVKEKTYPGLPMSDFTYMVLGYGSKDNFDKRCGFITDPNMVNKLRRELKVRFNSDVIDICSDDDLIPVTPKRKFRLSDLNELRIIKVGLCCLGYADIYPSLLSTTEVKPATLTKVAKEMKSVFKIVKSDEVRVTPGVIYTTLDLEPLALFKGIITLDGLYTVYNNVVRCDFNLMSQSDFKYLVDISIAMGVSIEDIYKDEIYRLGDFDDIYDKKKIIIGYRKDRGYTYTTIDSNTIIALKEKDLDNISRGDFKHVRFD